MVVGKCLQGGKYRKTKSKIFFSKTQTAKVAQCLSFGFVEKKNIRTRFKIPSIFPLGDSFVFTTSNIQRAIKRKKTTFFFVTLAPSSPNS